MYTTYILKSLKNKGYYVGSTRNFKDRLERHFSGRSIAAKNRLPLVLIYKEDFTSYGQAYRFEMWLKKQKSKKFIEDFIKKTGKKIS